MFAPPRTSSTYLATSIGSGGVSIIALTEYSSGSWTRGEGLSSVRGSVMVCANADAAAVSGLTRHTPSSPSQSVLGNSQAR